MLRKFFGMALLVSLFATCLSLDTMVVQAAAARPAYTVLVYMVGSNLESEDGSASTDLSEMMNIGSTKNVNVIVETGGSKKWSIKGISNTSNQRWKVNKNSMTLVKGNLGNRSMGKQSTLQDFLVWGVKTYPAQKYALVLWDHGGGAVVGFGYDEKNPNNDPTLTLKELSSAVKAATTVTKKKFELVGFDACLMGNIETATCLKDSASYLVASEEIEPGHGWDYTYALSALTKTPSLSGAGWGKAIVDGYKAQAKAEQDSNQVTLAVINLAKINTVNVALEGFIKKASADIKDPKRIVTVAKARTKAEDYGDGGQQGGATDMADLYSIAANLKAAYPTEANKLMASIKASITYRMSGSTKPNANGLSIYFPCKDKANFQSNLKYYANSGYLQSYQTFLKNYVAKLLASQKPIKLSQSVPKCDPGNNFQIQIAKEDIGRVNEIYSVLAIPYGDDGNSVLFLGMDQDVQLNPTTGVVKDNFNGYWMTLGGQYVSMFLQEVGDDYCTYTIPVKLNGEDVSLLVLYNDDYPTGAIIGAWRGTDPETGMPDKKIIDIYQGDTIIPEYYCYDDKDGSVSFVEGEPFTVGDQLDLEYTPLPEGDYLYGFYITDTNQNDTYSQFCMITLDEEGNVTVEK